MIILPKYTIIDLENKNVRGDSLKLQIINPDEQIQHLVTKKRNNEFVRVAGKRDWID